MTTNAVWTKKYSEATVSVSTVGITIYISWEMVFLSLICLLFFLITLSEVRRYFHEALIVQPLLSVCCCCCCFKRMKVPLIALDLVNISRSNRYIGNLLCVILTTNPIYTVVFLLLMKVKMKFSLHPLHVALCDDKPWNQTALVPRTSPQ